MKDISRAETQNHASLPDLVSQYNTEFAEKQQGIQQMKDSYQELESSYQAADDLVYTAEKAAEDAYTMYKIAEEITQGLLIKEEEARLSAELAITLGNDGAAKQIEENNDLRELLTKTLGGIQQDSAKAKENLEEKRAARLAAEKEQANLNLLAAVARLKAAMTSTERAKANEQRIDAENRLQIAENELKIYFAQLEALRIFSNAKSCQDDLEQLLTEQKEVSIEAAKVGDPELFISNIQKELEQKLENTGTDLLPYEKELLLCGEKIQKLEDAYNRALAEANAAQALLEKRLLEAKELDKDMQLVHDTTSKEYEKISIQCRQALEANKPDIAALKEYVVQTWEEARAAEQALEATKNEIAEARKKQSQLEENIRKSKSIEPELLRMLATSQNANLPSGSSSISEALSKAKEEITRQSAELENVIAHIGELEQQATVQRNTIHNAKYAAAEIEKNIKEANDEFARFEQDINAQLELGKATMISLRNNAEQQAKKGHELVGKNELATKAANEKVRQLEAELDKAKADLEQKKAARDEAKQRIHDYIDTVHEEAAAAITMCEGKVLSLWEKIERLRLAAAEKRSELERILTSSRNVSGQEQHDLSNLDATVSKANLRIANARQQTRSIAAQYQLLIADINTNINSIKAFDADFEKNSGAAIADATSMIASATAEAAALETAAPEQEYTTNIPVINIPNLQELGMDEPYNVDKPFFDSKPIAAQISSIIAELVAKYSGAAAEELLNFSEKELAEIAAAQENLSLTSMLADTESVLVEEDAVPSIIGEGAQDLSEEERSAAITDATQAAFQKEMAKVSPTEETETTEEQEVTEEQEAEAAIIEEESADENVSDVETSAEEIADEQADATVISEDEEQQETEAPVQEDELPAQEDSVPEEPVSPAELTDSAGQAAVQETIEEEQAISSEEIADAQEEDLAAENDVENAPEAEQTEQQTQEEAATEPADDAAEQQINVAEPPQEETIVDAELPQKDAIEDTAAEAMQEVVVIAAPIEAEVIEAETATPETAAIEEPSSASEAVSTEAEDTAAESTTLPIEAAEATPETEAIESAAEDAANPQIAPIPLQRNDNNRQQKRKMFGKKNAANSITAINAEAPIGAQAPPPDIIPSQDAAAPATNDQTAAAQPPEEDEANRISAEIEAMRLKLAVVTYEQRKEQEELDAKQREEEEEKRRKAEAESARLRAEEEAAQQAAAEEAARINEELRQASLAAERLAANAAAEMNIIPPENAQPADATNVAEVASSEDAEDDADTDIEIELRRLILSGLDKK